MPLLVLGAHVFSLLGLLPHFIGAQHPVFHKSAWVVQFLRSYLSGKDVFILFSRFHVWLDIGDHLSSECGRHFFLSAGVQ